MSVLQRLSINTAGRDFAAADALGHFTTLLSQASAATWTEHQSATRRRGDLYGECYNI
ncbi:hypothetical protein [Pseudomonas shirazensis]|uniref:hypothetical protein n=1 Tax=Pseudomonas shirazensis TaxID=2745494 RepID=UPI003D296E89